MPKQKYMVSRDYTYFEVKNTNQAMNYLNNIGSYLSSWNTLKFNPKHLSELTVSNFLTCDLTKSINLHTSFIMHSCWTGSLLLCNYLQSFSGLTLKTNLMLIPSKFNAISWIHIGHTHIHTVVYSEHIFFIYGAHTDGCDLAPKPLPSAATSRYHLFIL